MTVEIYPEPIDPHPETKFSIHLREKDVRVLTRLVDAGAFLTVSGSETYVSLRTETPASRALLLGHCPTHAFPVAQVNQGGTVFPRRRQFQGCLSAVSEELTTLSQNAPSDDPTVTLQIDGERFELHSNDYGGSGFAITEARGLERALWYDGRSAIEKASTVATGDYIELDKVIGWHGEDAGTTFTLDGTASHLQCTTVTGRTETVPLDVETGSAEITVRGTDLLAAHECVGGIPRVKYRWGEEGPLILWGTRGDWTVVAFVLKDQ